MKSLSQGLQVLGNNIAKRQLPRLQVFPGKLFGQFYLHMNDAEAGPDGEPSNNIQQHGTGVHVSSVSSNFNQGTIEVTGLDLDLAIQGEALPNAGGFFEIADPLLPENFFIPVPGPLNRITRASWSRGINIAINCKGSITR